MSVLDPLTRLTMHGRDYEDGDLTHEEFAVDMLATLRHFCDCYAVDFAEADRVAYMHYTAERSSFDCQGVPE